MNQLLWQIIFNYMFLQDYFTYLKLNFLNFLYFFKLNFLIDYIFTFTTHFNLKILLVTYVMLFVLSRPVFLNLFLSAIEYFGFPSAQIYYIKDR